jgi:hypothetical protein
MRYQRVLRLPCDDIRSGIGFKATLDVALKQLVEGLFKSSEGFKIELGDHTGGHMRALITRGEEKFEVEGCYGQNSSFAEGKKVAFVSYTVRAEVLGGGNGDSQASESAELLGKVAGVVIAVALACALLSPILKSSKFIYCIPVLAAAGYAGRCLGIKAARIVAGATQGNAGASSGGDKTQAVAMWKRLTRGIESVTDGFPTA